MKRGKEMNKYPKLLTIRKTDEYEHFKTFENSRNAKYYADKIGGHLYTQVDAGMTVSYVKGFTFVNRTGIYLVIK